MSIHALIKHRYVIANIDEALDFAINILNEVDKALPPDTVHPPFRQHDLRMAVGVIKAVHSKYHLGRIKL